MLTRNFYGNMFCSVISNYGYLGTDSNGVTGKYIGSSFGVSQAMKNGKTDAISASSASSQGVFFGTGTTPPTPNDYTLEAQITSGINITNPSAPAVNVTADYLEITATYGITASKDTVISEIGLFGHNNGSTIMLDRTVLENPIEIPKGQSKQVTYTVRINYPTA